MRLLILFISTLLMPASAIAQCNCEKIKRDDGTTVTQCPTLPVSSDNFSQIGMSLASNGGSNFVTLTIRFKGTAQNVKGKMTIRLADNSMFSLDFISGGLSYIGNSQVANAVFTLNVTNSVLLKKSNIKTVSFTLADNLLHTYNVNTNADVIKNELFCL